MRFARGKRIVDDNIRRNNIEAQEFIYPDDELRISNKEAKQGAGLLGAATLESFGRIGIPLPFGRGLIPVVQKLAKAANRPVASTAQHVEHLNKKFGNTGWDVFVNRHGQEKRNTAFHWNEQDLGNDNVFVQRENKRFAGDVLSDEWLEDIRAHGIEQDVMEEGAELANQRSIVNAIHGEKEAAAFMDPNNPSKSSEQQLSKQLLYGNIEGPIIAPPDRILGSSLSPDVLDSKQGINGTFSSDSEVRRNVIQDTSNPDVLNIDRGDVYTEVYTPEEIESTYQIWKNKTEKENLENGSDHQRSTDREQFNNLFGEYYGQQAYKLKGMQAPSLDERSGGVQRNQFDAERNEFISDKGARGDRLIEWNNGILKDNVNRFEPMDFRFRDNGQIKVADFQRGSTNGDLSFNVFKASELNPSNIAEFEDNLIRVSQELQTNDLDAIMKSMVDQGLIGAPAISQAKARSEGFRAGKATSGADFMGVYDSKMDNTANDETMFALHSPGQRSGAYDMHPQDIKVASGTAQRAWIGRQLLTGRGLPNMKLDSKGRLDVVADASPAPSFLTPQEMLNINHPFALK